MFDTNEQLDNYINDLAGIEPDNTPDVNEQEPSADTSRSDGSSDFFFGG